MSSLCVEHVEPSFSAASWGSLVVLVWRDHIEPRHLQIAHDVERAVIDRADDATFSVLNVYAAERMVRMDEQTRLVAAALLQDVGPSMMAQAHVVEDAGFKGSAVRALIGTLWTLARVDLAYETFADVGDALAWLAALPDQDPLVDVYRDRLTADVRALIADVPRSPDAPLPVPPSPAVAEVRCPNLSRCPMFAELENQRSLRVFQNLYCRHDFSRCARFDAMQRGTPPDPRLLPNGKLLAE